MSRTGCGVPPDWIHGEAGQTLAEYALILLFIAVACVAALTALGTPILGFYSRFNGSF